MRYWLMMLAAVAAVGLAWHMQALAQDAGNPAAEAARRAEMAKRQAELEALQAMADSARDANAKDAAARDEQAKRAAEVAAKAAATDAGTKPAASQPLELKHKWVFTMGPVSSDDNVKGRIELLKRAKKAGYTGMVVQDPGLSDLGKLDDHLAENFAKLRKAFDEEGMTMISTVCPMGYSALLLGSDPNLAEGMPVRGASFAVKGGKLVPADEVKLQNGNLAEWSGNTPTGWTVDKPDTISFKDESVKYKNNPTLRQEHASGQGVIRMIQKIKVEPWHYYHISVMAKTEDMKSKDFRIFALAGDPAKGGLNLTWEPPDIKATMDWTKFDACFDSMDNKEVSIYVGCYSPKSGKVWWSDVQVEPAGFVNVLRRDDLPLTVTTADGKALAEGKDFAKVADPKLGNDPKVGQFSYWHDQPTVTIPAGSSLKEGDKVLASYHFVMPAGKAHQVNCCVSEPKIYELLEKQAAWAAKNVKADGYQMSHDEIRLAGQDDACTKRNMTCGQMLSENVAKCSAIYQKAMPGKIITVWNDMFDPFHNAKKEGPHYLVKDSFYGSWEGLPTSVIVMNWRNNGADSVKFFADRGNPQILCGYYDQDPQRMKAWLEMAAGQKGIVGVMYTTWLHDYTKLEDWIKVVNDFEAAQKK